MKRSAYQQLIGAVSEVRRHLRLITLLQGTCLLVISCLFLLLAGVGLDSLLPFSSLARIIFLAFLLITFLTIFTKGLLIPLFTPFSNDRLALYIAKRYPQLKDNLINALQLKREMEKPLAGTFVSEEMVDVLVEETAVQIRSLRLKAAVSKTRLKRYTLISLIILLIAIFLGSAYSPIVSASLARVFNPFSETQSPLGPKIQVIPGDCTVLRGETKEIKALISEGRADKVSLKYRMGEASGLEGPLAWKEGWEVVSMRELKEGEFSHTFPLIIRPIQYLVKAHRAQSSTYLIKTVEPPEIGDITLKYRYPPYTKLAPRVIEKSGGNIEALVGTRVTLKARANKELRSAYLVTDDGIETPMQINKGVDLENDLFITGSKRYKIKIEDREGYTNPQPIEYTILALEDEFPSIEVIKPGQDLTVSEKARLRLSYEAGDDFGITRVSLVYRLPGEEEGREIKIKEFHPTERRGAGDYEWDLGELNLRPGDVVSYFLKAGDNDRISGPKEGVSRTYYLEIFSFLKEHRALEKLQETFTEELLQLLAQQLENREMVTDLFQTLQKEARFSEEDLAILSQAREGQREIKEKAERIVTDMEEMLKRMEEDPLTTYPVYLEYQSLKENLSHLTAGQMEEALRQLGAVWEKDVPDIQERGLKATGETQDKIIEELEKMVLFSEELSKRQRAEEVLKDAQNLVDIQSRFADQLRDLEKIDEEMLRRLTEELTAFENLFKALQEKFSEMAGELPDEFLNYEAMKTLDFGQIQSQLDQMFESLQAGDLEKALEEVEALLSALSEMMEMFQAATSQLMPYQQSGFQLEVNEFLLKLHEVIRTEEGIIDETAGIHKAVSTIFWEKQKKELKGLLRKQRKIINRSKETLDEMLRESRKTHAFPQPLRLQLSRKQREMEKVIKSYADFRTADLPSLSEKILSQLTSLKAEVIDYFREKTREEKEPIPYPEVLAHSMKVLEELIVDVEEIVNSLKEFEVDVDQLLLPEQKEGLDRLSLKQGQAGEETVVLKGMFDQMARKTPLMDPSIGEDLDQADYYMEEAMEKLSRRRAGEALPPEREALYHLNKSRDSFQESMQKMAAQMQMCGVPMPQLMLMPLPQAGLPWPQRGDFASGRMGFRTQYVPLPSPEEYKAPREFRQDILEAMKEGYLPRYRELIEEYYKRLIE